MTGNQRDAARVNGVSTALNIVINLAFIPTWGVEGAAAATTISTVISSFVLAIIVHNRLEVHSSVLGKITVPRKAGPED